MKELIFWGSHLWLPFAIVAALIIMRTKGVTRTLTALALLVSCVLAYARFIEPRILHIEQAELVLPGADTNTSPIRIALFSDTHFGVYKNAMPMNRIVGRINRQAPDAVFIAGDFLYHLPAQDIPKALAPLAALQAPVFAVLGNHDVGFPGPVYTADLYAALETLGVTSVENRAVETILNGQPILIGGTSDLWQRQQDYTFSRALPDKPLILLTHNPDTALRAPQNLQFDLMLAGHTHGGQVRIPGIVSRVIPTQYPFDKGLHRVETLSGERLVYVTPGTGMVGLPLRFNMPPRIDLLTIYLPVRP